MELPRAGPPGSHTGRPARKQEARGRMEGPTALHEAEENRAGSYRAAKGLPRMSLGSHRSGEPL